MNKKSNNSKPWKGVVTLIVIIALLFGCAQVGVVNPDLFKRTPKVEGDFITGTYTASEQGFGGEVTVNMTVNENGGVSELTLEGPGETPDVGGAAIPTLQEAMLAAQSADVDSVSGASITSEAAKKAAAKAFAEAKGEEVAEETAEETEGAEETTEEAVSTNEDATGDLISGTYTASELGFAGNVTINMTVNENGGVSELTLEGPDETPEIGGAALPKLQEAMLTAQSADVDSVSGATFTSDGAKAAAEKAFAQARGEEVAEETTESGDAAEETAAATGDAAETTGTLTAGTYTASEDGFGGTVTFTMTVADDGSISELTLDGPDETPEVGGAALPKLQEAMLAAQSADVDSVSGASITSEAAKNAAAKAFAEAAGSADAGETTGTLTAGTYSASEDGFGGTVTFTMTVADDGSISELTLEGPDETPEVGGAALPKLQEAMLAAQSADVDSVSGASVTSEAAKNAAAKAFAEAAGSADEAAVEDGNKPADGDLFVPGTYTGTANGFGGEINVEMTVTENEITDVKIEGEKETANIGTFAVDLLDDDMIEAQTSKVDALTGATVTSKAIIKAASDALKEAGADVDALENKAAVDENAEKTDETLEADVVIVGAGGAGMTAAITATQQGKKVILVEKMPYVGGNTTKATGGMNAAETHYQAESDPVIEDSVEQFIEDTMKGGHDMNDIALVTKMAEESADGIDWLDSIGAPLPKVSFSGGATNARIHAPEDGSGVGAYLVTAFLNQLNELGIEVLYETKATEIIMTDGAATGIKAEGKTANYTINAGAVIITTGGFGANMDMITQYRPDLDGTVSTSAPGVTGDGIVMATAVGADLVDIDQIQLHPTVEQGTSMLITEGVRGDGAILVNSDGKRFYNEMETRDHVSAAELEQEGSYAYVVFDQRLRDNLAAIEKYVSVGIVSEGETIEDLANAIGVDPTNLSETLAKWNEAVAAGKDEEFGRETGMEEDLSVAPYYAIKIAPGIHHTMGGLKINTNAQVINTEGNVIPGLFAAGEVTGGVHGGNRIGGNAVADIVVFGRTAGNNVAAYLDGTLEDAAESGNADETGNASEE